MSQLILGIETSCDETAAAVVAGGRRIRSNIILARSNYTNPLVVLFRNWL